MSRGSWDREATTGLPKKLFEQIDDEFRRADGSLDTDLFPDCNVWNQTSAAWLACGWRNVARIAETMVADPDYPWVLITGGNGRVITRATHSNTAAGWGNIHTTAGRARQFANLKPFRVCG